MKQKLSLVKNLLIDAFDFVFRSLLAEIDGSYQEETITGDIENYLQTARNFAEFGLYDRAISALLNCDQESPLKHYYLAYYYDKEGKEKKAKKALAAGARQVRQKSASRGLLSLTEMMQGCSLSWISSI